jgi:hypothetical protein
VRDARQLDSMRLGRNDMKYGDNPLQANYWFGTTDPRPQALFRWLFGLTVCHDLLNYSRDLRAFATDEGMMPRGVQADPHTWSVFELVGSTAGVGVLFACGLAVVICFTVGYRTRVAAALSWLFLTALHTRNLYVTDGGDDLVRCLMFISIFADLGRCWSVDARRTGLSRQAYSGFAFSSYTSRSCISAPHGSSFELAGSGTTSYSRSCSSRASRGRRGNSSVNIPRCAEG